MGLRTIIPHSKYTSFTSSLRLNGKVSYRIISKPKFIHLTVIKSTHIFSLSKYTRFKSRKIQISSTEHPAIMDDPCYCPLDTKYGHSRQPPLIQFVVPRSLQKPPHHRLLYDSHLRFRPPT